MSNVSNLHSHIVKVDVAREGSHPLHPHYLPSPDVQILPTIRVAVKYAWVGKCKNERIESRLSLKRHGEC